VLCPLTIGRIHLRPARRPPASLTSSSCSSPQAARQVDAPRSHQLSAINSQPAMAQKLLIADPDP